MSKTDQSFWSKLSKKLTNARPIESEEDIMTDHDYDGIKELDNVLPPWWTAGFIISIIVGIIYTGIVIFTDKYDQNVEFENAVAEGTAAVAQYKKEHPELYDAANLKALTDASSIQKGKELFASKTCTACHLADGGGSIGPNLTDEYWILDGDFQGIMNTIAKGGRPGKGMIAWESNINLEERQQLASYILTLKGTTPANPKDPEGEIWKESGE